MTTKKIGLADLFRFTGILSLMLSPYLLIFILGDETLRSATMENGPIETTGAVFFLGAAILFFLSAGKGASAGGGTCTRKRIAYLVLGLFAFVSFGEEINWGQNLTDMKTPRFMKKINAQKEFNIHNLKIFHYWDKKRKAKTGWRLAVTSKSLFTYFWISFCLIIPLLYYFFRPARRLITKAGLPIVPLWMGLLFLTNYEVKRIIPLYRTLERQNIIEEIFECVIAFLFMLAAWHFFKGRRPETETGLNGGCGQ